MPRWRSGSRSTATSWRAGAWSSTATRGRSARTRTSRSSTWDSPAWGSGRATATSSTTGAASAGCHDRGPLRPMSAQVEIRDVSKAFGGVQAVTKVSLDVDQGQVFSVIGPNGAGKTTVLNMISGFYHPDTGRIVLEGTDVTTLSPSRTAARGAARTFHNIALFKGMTVPDNLMLGRHVHMS